MKRPAAHAQGLLFFAPRFAHKPWGGNRLAPLHRVAFDGECVGECLAIAGREGNDSLVASGPLRGTPLSHLWQERRDLFGGVEGDEFPLHVKLIDAREDLSFQVHPHEGYAREVESDGAKNECWIFLEPSHDGTVGLGHNAACVADFEARAREGRWDELVRDVPAHRGDYVDIPAGTAHCLHAGSLVYEVLQASDVTYRIHDHHRVERPTHLDKAVAVLTCPDTPDPLRPLPVLVGDARVTIYPRGDHFAVRRVELQGSTKIAVDAPFLIVSVVGGSGRAAGVPVSVGDHFIVTSVMDVVTFDGAVDLIVTEP